MNLPRMGGCDFAPECEQETMFQTKEDKALLTLAVLHLLQVVLQRLGVGAAQHIHHLAHPVLGVHGLRQGGGGGEGVGAAQPTSWWSQGPTTSRTHLDGGQQQPGLHRHVALLELPRCTAAAVVAASAAGRHQRYTYGAVHWEVIYHVHMTRGFWHRRPAASADLLGFRLQGVTHLQGPAGGIVPGQK